MKTLKKKLDELEKSRIELSKAVFSAREESKKFTSQIDSIDTELRLLDAEYEQAEMLLNQLTIRHSNQPPSFSATSKST